MRLVISGYYGYGNTGDEAILAALVSELRSRYPTAHLTVLSAAPQVTVAQHGVEAVPRWSLRAVWRSLRGADLLISGGGGLIQDTTSLLSPLYYLAILRLARLAGTPYMIFAQGLGPIRCKLTRWLTACCFQHAAAITLRDAQSAQLLEEIGADAPQMHVTADPALLLTPCSAARSQELLAESSITEQRPLIGIALRHWPDREVIAPTAVLIQHLRETLGAQVLLLPLQPEQDLNLAWRLASEVGGHISIFDQPASPRELFGVVSQLDLLVAMRLHGLIFAAARQLPALALIYDPKVEAFAQRAGQPRLALTDLSAGLLVDATEQLWENRARQATQREIAARRLCEDAARNFAILANLLGDHRRDEEQAQAR